MRELNLAFRFVLEMVVLVAVAIWAHGASSQPIVALTLGLSGPAVAIALSLGPTMFWGQRGR